MSGGTRRAAHLGRASGDEEGGASAPTTHPLHSRPYGQMMSFTWVEDYGSHYNGSHAYFLVAFSENISGIISRFFGSLNL